MDDEELKIPKEFHDKVAGFPESSYGANRIETDLANGKRMHGIFVAGDGTIVKVGTKTIVKLADVGSRPSDIITVTSEIS